MDETQSIYQQSEPQETTALTRRAIPRRTVVLGLAGLVLGGLGMIGLGIEGFKRLYTYSPALLTYRGHTHGVNSVAWSPDGRRIASASKDGTIQVWNASTGKRLLTFGTQIKGSYGGPPVVGLLTGDTMAWSPDGTRIAAPGELQSAGSTTSSDDLWLWDATTGETLTRYSGQDFSDVIGLAWSPDGTRLAFTGDYGTIHILNVTTRSIVLTYQGGKDSIAGAMAWSPDGARIVSAGEDDNAVLVWDATTGQTLLKYEGHSSTSGFSGVQTLAWSPDSRRIASGGWDGTAQVWDSHTGQRLVTYSGHNTGQPSEVSAVAWSPDGTRIASGGDDETAQVWNASTGEQLLMYQGHSALVTSVAWSPDGSRIASGSGDTTVQVWRPT